MECVVEANVVSGLYWYIMSCTDIVFISMCQVSFFGSSSVRSQLRVFELRQLSNGPQPSYVVEYLDQMAINGKFVAMLSSCSLKNSYLLVYKTHL